jgi:hypothetical protein
MDGEREMANLSDAFLQLFIVNTPKMVGVRGYNNF